MGARIQRRQRGRLARSHAPPDQGLRQVLNRSPQPVCGREHRRVLLFDLYRLASLHSIVGRRTSLCVFNYRDRSVRMSALILRQIRN